VKLKDLIPDEKNANKGSERGQQLLENSLRKCGAGRSILIDKNGRILAGNKTVENAGAIGMDDVIVVQSDGTKLVAVQRTDLDLTKDKAAKDLAIFDNRVSEVSLSWDVDVLKELDAEIDLKEFWTEAELDILLGSVVPSELLGDEDSVPEVPDEPVTKPGDLYILGNHRVMCGDSTSVTDVDLLMAGEKADMVFTDPPYGIDYQDTKGKHKKIANDANLDGIGDLIGMVLSNNCPMFICCNWKCFSTFEAAMIAAERNPKSCIVWDKRVRVQNLDRFYKQHEFIIYHGPFGGQKTVDGDVWRCDREVRSDHPTAKPVELIAKALEYASMPRQIVQDLFGGSGSTLIACEKLGRKARLMELDCRYVDVILNRWSELTGKDPVREDGVAWSALKAGASAF
jgi:DNA modification methylase